MYLKRSTIYEELAIVTGFAFFLARARSYADWFARSIVGKLLIRYGTITYSLYLVHMFNVVVIGKIASKVVPSSWPKTNIFIQIVIHIGLATLFWFLCERPFLNRPLPISKLSLGSMPSSSERYQAATPGSSSEA
jgi:peptidoglycan/LPS O-acetylase OafA/YrhL